LLVARGQIFEELLDFLVERHFFWYSTPEKPGIYGKMTARATRMVRKTCFHDQMTIRFLRF
jgi:hypothetical protein